MYNFGIFTCKPYKSIKKYKYKKLYQVSLYIRQVEMTEITRWWGIYFRQTLKKYLYLVFIKFCGANPSGSICSQRLDHLVGVSIFLREKKIL